MTEEEFVCDECEKSFSTERGLHVHASKVHDGVEDKKVDLKIMKVLKDKDRDLDDIARELDKSKHVVENRIEELMEKEWVQKQVDSGKDAYYKITEVGEEVVVPLMKDIVEETKDYIEDVSEAFKNRVGPRLPKISVEWPEEDE